MKGRRYTRRTILAAIAGTTPAISFGGVKLNDHRTNGTRWLGFCAGTIIATKSAVFSRCTLVRTGAALDRLELKQYGVQEKGGIEALKSWLIENVAPHLNTRSTDDGMYAEMPEFSLTTYCSSERTHENCLLGIPLSSVFRNFGAPEFEALLKKFGAKNVA